MLAEKPARAGVPADVLVARTAADVLAVRLELYAAPGREPPPVTIELARGETRLGEARALPARLDDARWIVTAELDLSSFAAGPYTVRAAMSEDPKTALRFSRPFLLQRPPEP